MSDPGNESDAARKARNGRNIALALGLVVFVILIFVVTVFKIQGNVANRPF